MLKRFITSLFCLFLIFASMPIWGYSHFLCGSVYADSGSGSVGTDWNRVTTNDEMVQSFLAYCKSRDSNIVGGAANAVSNFTYSMMQQLAMSVGIDLNELQSELYYKQVNNQGIQWFMTATGIQAYNSLFARLISENGFEVGEPADKVLYSGRLYVDKNGIGYFLYEFNSSNSRYSKKGTDIYTSSYLSNCLSTNTIPSSTTIKVSNNETWTISFVIVNGTMVVQFLKNNVEQARRQCVSSSYACDICLLYATNSNQYFFGVHFNNNDACQGTVSFTPQSDEVTPNSNISFVSNNIKQEYHGDTYINNEGDNITNNNPGGQNPGWNVGGGQGSYLDGDGNSYTINFPDFELPDLNIDWSISGLGNKFPFSIPFDIVSLVTVLNAEPEAPRFQGTVNFGFTTWDYDINLEQFDTVAQVCRIAELLLLVFGLILITRSIIKG